VFKPVLHSDVPFRPKPTNSLGPPLVFVLLLRGRVQRRAVLCSVCPSDMLALCQNRQSFSQFDNLVVLAFLRQRYLAKFFCSYLYTNKMSEVMRELLTLLVRPQRFFKVIRVRITSQFHIQVVIM